MHPTKHRFGLHTSQDFSFSSCAILMRIPLFALLYAKSVGIEVMSCPFSNNVSIVILTSMDVLSQNHMILWDFQVEESLD
jgi:hypothetical protein